ncbi:MAG: hypothetical protein EBT28_03795 [Betaproteobacteria bacterium]|nr:hypothetical protein [Betaproteobacteria bacterium]
MLTEVVQINGSLRPAVLPWTSTQETVDSALSGLPDQELLAQKVIERVESQLANKKIYSILLGYLMVSNFLEISYEA